MEIAWAFDGNVEVQTSRECVSAAGVIIGPHEWHHCRLWGTALQGTLLVSPLTPAGRRLMPILGPHSVKTIAAEVIEEFSEILVTPSPAFVLEAVRRLIERLGSGVPPERTDPRIAHIKSALREEFDQPVPVRAMAASVGLSESRLSHLFKEEVGMPIRSYRRWLRVRAGMKSVLAGVDATTAAHAAGFSDLADFTRLCRKTFGLPPSSAKDLRSFCLHEPTSED